MGVRLKVTLFRLLRLHPPVRSRHPSGSRCVETDGQGRCLQRRASTAHLSGVSKIAGGIRASQFCERGCSLRLLERSVSRACQVGAGAIESARLARRARQSARANALCPRRKRSEGAMPRARPSTHGQHRPACRSAAHDRPVRVAVGLRGGITAVFRACGPHLGRTTLCTAWRDREGAFRRRSDFGDAQWTRSANRTRGQSGALPKRARGDGESSSATKQTN